MKSDGSVWFSDPSYGIADDYLGRRAEAEIDGCHVFRVDAVSGAVVLVADDLVRPNGLAFSPDETKLYVADSGRTVAAEHPAHLRVFDVGADHRLTGGGVFAECTAGVFDGLRVDVAGNLWVSAADGVHCYAPCGSLVGKVLVPEAVANCAFGGPLLNRLFITATASLYAIYLTTNGVSLC